MTLFSIKKYFKSQNHDKNHFLFIPDDSYYNYAGWQSKHYLSSFDDGSLEIRLIDDENVGRIRRELVVNEPKDESVKDQPSSQPQQQQQQAPQLVNMTNTQPTTHDVKYLSAYSTSEATVQFRTTEVASTPIIQVQSFKDADGKISSLNSTNSKKKVTQPVKADDTVSAMMD